MEFSFRVLFKAYSLAIAVFVSQPAFCQIPEPVKPWQLKPVGADSISSAIIPVLSLFAQENILKPPKTVQSPNAATLGSYGEIAVSPYTGKADIHVDLHTINEGNIRIPVS